MNSRTKSAKNYQMPEESEPTSASAIPAEQLAQRQYRLASASSIKPNLHINPSRQI